MKVDLEYFKEIISCNHHGILNQHRNFETFVMRKNESLLDLFSRMSTTNEMRTTFKELIQVTNLGTKKASREFATKFDHIIIVVEGSKDMCMSVYSINELISSIFNTFNQVE